jgi:hypothetical protein
MGIHPLTNVLFWAPDPSRLLDHPAVSLWMRPLAALIASRSTGNTRAVQISPPTSNCTLRVMTTILAEWGAKRLTGRFWTNTSAG